jgi:hypothetical protein
MTLFQLKQILPYIDTDDDGDLYLDGVHEGDLPEMAVPVLFALPDLIAAVEALKEYRKFYREQPPVPGGDRDDPATDALLARLGVE